MAAANLHSFNHSDYAPGRRFYFFDPDGIEFEVVSYQSARTPKPLDGKLLGARDLEVAS